MTRTFRFGALAAVAVAALASAGLALACTSKPLGCLETSSGRTNTITITNITMATLPANSWIYWKNAGGDGKLTTSAAIAYRGTVLVARPLGAVSPCNAYYVTP